MNRLLIPVVAGIVTFVLVLVVANAKRVKRRRNRPRIVEQPNSHYTSQLVRDRDSFTVWDTIPLDRVHEINRGEVKRLLAKATALGVENLRVEERRFLDQIALITGAHQPPPEPPTRVERGQNGEAVRSPGASAPPQVPAPHHHS